jgi:hypothetical protein
MANLSDIIIKLENKVVIVEAMNSSIRNGAITCKDEDEFNSLTQKHFGIHF